MQINIIVRDTFSPTYYRLSRWSLCICPAGMTTLPHSEVWGGRRHLHLFWTRGGEDRLVVQWWWQPEHVEDWSLVANVIPGSPPWTREVRWPPTFPLPPGSGRASVDLPEWILTHLPALSAALHGCCQQTLWLPCSWYIPTEPYLWSVTG